MKLVTCLLLLLSASPAVSPAPPKFLDPKEVWSHIRSKDERELRHILAELNIPYGDDLSVEELREHVYDEDAMEQWLERHPEERLIASGGSGLPGFDDLGGIGPPTEELLRGQQGQPEDFDFDPSEEKNKDKRAILEKLKDLGIKDLGRYARMPLKQLKGIEKIMDGEMGDEL
uniref:Uncharacterized protein n=1 Tax=Trieres chinensis TaxID=1514140 RepID=A0A7S1ZZP5_TRICV|mmetsp:Transcript_3649/g.7799  ORF Transcript_3649/g.7799 Transcript_3649/m.7799 type:complete len:173 (+) Transcript_3649:58-576(+)